MQASVAITVRPEDVIKVFQAENWRDAATLRSAFADAKPVGYFSTDELACVIVDATEAYHGAAKAVQRSVVVLKQNTLIMFDVVAGGTKAFWALNGDTANLNHKSIPFSNGTSDQVFLNVFQEKTAANIGVLSTLDLAGVRIGEYAILFYVDVRAGRSAVFFDSNGGDKLKTLVAGLAPGSWEVWRNGWLDEPRVVVTREANALYYEGEPGGYFLKRTS